MKHAASMTLRQAVHGRDLPSMFHHWEQTCPDKPFLIWAPSSGEDQQWSYLEFAQQARRLAQGLHQQGIGPGQRVLIHLDNSPEFLFSWYACALLGAVAVTTNTRSVAHDIDYFIDKAEICAVISHEDYVDLFANKRSELKFLADASGNNSGKADFALSALYDQQEFTQPSDVKTMDELSIQFTSGTTSRPKAVVWTHANAVWGAQCNARNLALHHDDICQAFLPLFHTNNQSYSLLGTIWVGGTYVLQEKFSKSHFWRPALKYKATWAAMIPFCVKALAEVEVPKHNFRFWTPAVSLPDLEDHFGLKMFGLYGMTETITQPIVADPVNCGPQMSIGRPCHGYEVWIRGEDGQTIEAGETGDLFLRGTPGINLFKEYLNDPKATEASFTDGWFETGDRIRMAEDGNLFFADRSKDMLKVGGENIAASEIESIISDSGLVSEVAVVGQPHTMLDEVPVAFVIPNPGVDVATLKHDIITLCKEMLADFKVVKDVYIVEDMPRSLLNKISKKDLRDKLPTLS